MNMYELKPEERPTIRPTARDLTVEADILEAHAREIVRKGQALKDQGERMIHRAQQLRGRP
jgi:hypothetical protein